MASNVKVNDWYFATLPTQAQFKNFPVPGCDLVYNFFNLTVFKQSVCLYEKSLQYIS